MLLARHILAGFWGDAVEIGDGARLSELKLSFRRSAQLSLREGGLDVDELPYRVDSATEVEVTVGRPVARGGASFLADSMRCDWARK